jgi:hypothetical protein
MLEPVLQVQKVDLTCMKRDLSRKGLETARRRDRQLQHERDSASEQINIPILKNPYRQTVIMRNADAARMGIVLQVAAGR